MLSLGHLSKKRPGFLHLFSKLNKLECLAGDVSALSFENRLMVGRREINWMMEHWVGLKKVMFFPKRYIGGKGPYWMLEKKWWRRMETAEDGDDENEEEEDEEDGTWEKMEGCCVDPHLRDTRVCCFEDEGS